jgi:hypothetical protein
MRRTPGSQARLNDLIPARNRVLGLGSVMTALALLIVLDGVEAQPAPATELEAPNPPLNLLNSGEFADDYEAPDNEYVEPEYSVLEGEKRPDGSCVLSGTTIAGPGATSVAVEELAFDPVRCESLLVSGEVDEDATTTDASAAASTYSSTGDGTTTAESQAGWSAGEVVGGSDEPEPNPRAQGGPCDQDDVFCGSQTFNVDLGAGTYRARGVSYFEDPPQLDVTKVQNTITWHPSHGCANYFGGNHERYMFWRNGTGWSRDWFDHAQGANCDRVYGQSEAVFKNDGFCPGSNTTWNSYAPNKVRGRTGGKAIHVWKTQKSGGCEWLLHFEHELTWSEL